MACPMAAAMMNCHGNGRLRTDLIPNTLMVCNMAWFSGKAIICVYCFTWHGSVAKPSFVCIALHGMVQWQSHHLCVLLYMAWFSGKAIICVYCLWYVTWHGSVAKPSFVCIALQMYSCFEPQTIASTLINELLQGVLNSRFHCSLFYCVTPGVNSFTQCAMQS